MQADISMLSPAIEIKKGATLAGFNAYIYLARSQLGETPANFLDPSFWQGCALAFAGGVQTVRVVEAQGLFNEVTLEINGENVSVTHDQPPTDQAFPELVEPIVSGAFSVRLLETGGPTVGQTMPLPSYQR
jgi:hypothetical protein